MECESLRMCGEKQPGQALQYPNVPTVTNAQLYSEFASDRSLWCGDFSWFLWCFYASVFCYVSYSGL